MAYNVKNIIVGAAAFFVSVKDSTDSTFYGANGNVAVALPTFTVSVSAIDPATGNLVGDTAGTNWRHVGFTSDGVEFSYEPDFGEVEVDQLLDAAKMFKQGMTASVNTTLAEATLTNLVLAWGQKGTSLGAAPAPDASTGEELGIASGALLDEPVERSLVFVGPAPRSATGNLKRERVYHVRRALNVEASAHSLSKTDATTIPVSLRLLPDPYYSGKEYGIIRDRNIEA
jgi:hypothetical protein